MLNERGKNMNCEKCQSLLSDYLDGTLTENDRVLFDAHLGECLECLSVQEDLSSIVTVARECRSVEFEPSNPRALWIRINNALESETQNLNIAPPINLDERKSFWSGLLNRRWELSLSQLAGVVAVVMLVVTFGTVIGLRGLPNRNDAATNAVTLNAPTKSNTVTNRFASQRMAIEYWQQRVEQRKVRWNPQMRETFERNINVIDQAVNDSMHDLDTNPHDEATEEMLNDAIRGKLELLKEFSEL
ncbi:MAG: hypothetical protein NVSMB56_16280 [Pyrinomonadaceae bacterium]